MNFMSGDLDHDIFADNSKLIRVVLAHNGREINVGEGVQNSGFTGKLPYEWPANLEWLDASQNSFTLSLEPSLCSLQLVLLKLDKNFINGLLPT